MQDKRLGKSDYKYVDARKEGRKEGRKKRKKE